MSPTDVAQIAYQAGFRGAGLIYAVAVSLAEDGSGNPNATNTTGNTPPSTDRGLWQINSYWHPEVTDAMAFDPLSAAQAAFRISNGGTDWSQWSTWPGAAGAELVRAANAVANANIQVVPGGPQPITSATPSDVAGIGQQISNTIGSIPSGTDVISSINDAAKTIGQIPISIGQGLDQLKNLGAFFQQPDLWIRFLMILGGGILILIGLSLTALSFIKPESFSIPELAAAAAKVI